MIALPVFVEQELCADFLTKHQFGLTLAPRKITGAALAKAIETLLENPRFRENAERFAEQVHAADGPKAAAQILIDHARSGEAAGAGI